MITKTDVLSVCWTLKKNVGFLENMSVLVGNVKDCPSSKYT